jgi:hypothetical protein
MVRSSRSIADYDSVFDPIRKAREEKSGHQAGDPIKAAEVLLKLFNNGEPAGASPSWQRCASV